MELKQEIRVVQQPTPERSLDEILRDAADIINGRRKSRDIIGLVRRPLSHEGGGDYLSEEVIARLP